MRWVLAEIVFSFAQKYKFVRNPKSTFRHNVAKLTIRYEKAESILTEEDEGYSTLNFLAQMGGQAVNIGVCLITGVIVVAPAGSVVVLVALSYINVIKFYCAIEGTFDLLI